MKQLTFKQYKAIDIALLSGLLVIFELLATYASTKWFFIQAVTISLTPLFLVIMMMRWGWWTAVPAVLGGIAFCLATGEATIENYFIYSIGNLFGVLVFFLVLKLGREKVRADWIKLVSIVISTYLSICIGRWIVSLVFEPTFKTLLPFITTDLISLIVAIVGALALRKADGMLEDQKSYLLRLDREARGQAEMRPAVPIPEYEDYDEDYDEELLTDDSDEAYDHEPDDGSESREDNYTDISEEYIQNENNDDLI